MAGAVIVALPSVDDKVYKISSEKIPHLTLCFLGDGNSADDLAEVVTYTQHAASQLSPFGLTVDYRGTLGADSADVLYFENGPFDAERINDFRHHLLLSDTIKRLYDGTDQFPEWTPHLTLGYPEAPAHEDTSDYPGIHYVQFDRIAVWLGNFDGPEFRLKYDDYPMMDMAMSGLEAEVARILKHSGVKGMRWGVRKDAPRGKFKRALTKANVATDAGHKVISEGEKKLIFLPQENRNKAAAATQAQVLATAASINKSAEFKGKDLKKDPALKQAYFDKVEAAAKKIYADELGIARTEAWADFLGTKVDTTAMRITAASNRIKHADDGEETLLVLNWELDELGQISDVTVPDEYLNHTEDLGLEMYHSGVKGMKWGVRKDEGHVGEKVKTKKLGKLDQKWEADMERNAYMKLYNKAADHMNNGGIDAINNSPKWKDVDFSKPENEHRLDEYMTDHENAFQAAMVAAGPSLGMNPSGTKQFVIKKVTSPEGEEYDDVFLEPVGLDLKHDEVSKAVAYRLNRGADGKVTDYEQVELELAHYGVKGMRWGVTTKDNAPHVTQTHEKKSLRNTKDVTVTQRKAGTYVQAKGGQRQKASEDAVKAQAGRQKAKKSTTDALSNKELKDTIERMRLEQEFAKLDAKVKRKGESFISKLLASPEARQAAQDLSKRVAAANQ